MLGPLDGVNPEIGAAIDRDHAVAVIFAAQIEQGEQRGDLLRIVRSLVEELKTSAEGAAGVDKTGRTGSRSWCRDRSMP